MRTVKPKAKPGNRVYRRDLPHIQADGQPVFATFATEDRTELLTAHRDIVMACCLHDHQTKHQLHCAVVMPDHVHLIFTALQDDQGCTYGFPEILGAIKSVSAHRINRLAGRRGRLWQEESFDHVVRCSESLGEKIAYLLNNPVRRGLAARASDYAWVWPRELCERLEPDGTWTRQMPTGTSVTVALRQV